MPVPIVADSLFASEQVELAKTLAGCTPLEHVKTVATMPDVALALYTVSIRADCCTSRGARHLQSLHGRAFGEIFHAPYNRALQQWHASQCAEDSDGCTCDKVRCVVLGDKNQALKHNDLLLATAFAQLDYCVAKGHLECVDTLPTELRDVYVKHSKLGSVVGTKVTATGGSPPRTGRQYADIYAKYLDDVNESYWLPQDLEKHARNFVHALRTNPVNPAGATESLVIYVYAAPNMKTTEMAPGCPPKMVRGMYLTRFGLLGWSKEEPLHIPPSFVLAFRIHPGVLASDYAEMESRICETMGELMRLAKSDEDSDDDYEYSDRPGGRATAGMGNFFASVWRKVRGGGDKKKKKNAAADPAPSAVTPPVVATEEKEEVLPVADQMYLRRLRRWKRDALIRQCGSFVESLRASHKEGTLLLDDEKDWHVLYVYAHPRAGFDDVNCVDGKELLGAGEYRERYGFMAYSTDIPSGIPRWCLATLLIQQRYDPDDYSDLLVYTPVYREMSQLMDRLSTTGAKGVAKYTDIRLSIAQRYVLAKIEEALTHGASSADVKEYMDILASKYRQPRRAPRDGNKRVTVVEYQDVTPSKKEDESNIDLDQLASPVKKGGRNKEESMGGMAFRGRA